MKGAQIAGVATVSLAGVLVVQLLGQTTPPTASLGDAIPLTGLAANQHGLALWNAAAGAPEPARTGHDTSWTSCSISAPYYLATRDHSTLDTASSAGFRATPVIDGLAGFTDALTTNGFATSDLTFSWSAQTLGVDVKGDDWLFDGATGIETRYYTGGDLSLRLRGELLAGGPAATTTLTINYNDTANCGDDTFAISTGVVVLENQAAGSSPAVQAVAAALVTAFAGNGLAITVDSLQPTDQTIADQGRSGSVLEAAAGTATVAPPCSCVFGVHDATATHEWTLIWPEAALPTNGPLQLKVVAVTLAPTAGTPAVGDPGRVTVTVFDDSAPETGVFVDVPFPQSKGEAEGALDLTVMPGTNYRFTVQHRGGSGRKYRLGASHAPLRLGQSDLRHVDGRSQDWGIEAGAGETVTIVLTTDDNPIDGNVQATSAFVTIIDPATNEILTGPTSLALTPSTPGSVSIQNTGTARRLVAQIDPNGAFRIRRTDGDQLLYSQPCPARTGLAATLPMVQTQIFTPICTLCHGGVVPDAGLNLQQGMSFANLVNVPSTQTNLLRVVPGDPEASYLIHKLEGRASIVGHRMPPPPFLSNAEIALVRGWILAGAQDN